MNPLFHLDAVARKVEAMGDYVLARQIARTAKAARIVLGASDEVALDSWTEFETWFLKNRAQGLEFVFEDQYGSDSAESEAVKQLLEGYDLMERQLHDLYIMLRGDAESAPAPVEEPEEAPAEEPAEEPAADEAPAEEEATPSEEATDELSESVDSLSTEGAEETPAEEPASEEAPAEENLDELQGKEASKVKTPETKMVARIQKLMKRAGVSASSITFRGAGAYRVTCASAESGDAVEAFFAKTGWQSERVDHPVKIMLDVVPGR